MTLAVNKDLFDLAGNLEKCQILNIKQMWQKQQQWAKIGDSDKQTNKPTKVWNVPAAATADDMHPYYNPF